MTEIRYTLRFLSDFHVGSGLGQGVADDVTYRDEHGALCIIATTIRGVVRNAVEELIPCLLPGRDAAPVIEAVFGPKDDRWDVRETRWHFGDAESSGDPYLYQRTALPHLMRGAYALRVAQRRADEQVMTARVSIDPRLRRAEDKRLFARIDGAQTVQFTGAIAPILTPLAGEKELLELALLWVRSLGRGRRRGAGACRFILDDNRARQRMDGVLRCLTEIG